MDLLHAHLCDRLFAGANVDGRVFIKDNTLYKHPISAIEYTTYDLKRDEDSIHLGFRNQGVMVYSPTLPGAEPWLYAHVVAIYHVLVYTVANPEPKRLELLWVRWMERDSTQLRGPNSSQYTRVSFVQHSGVPGEAFGFVDPSHIIRGCHLIPTFHLQRTRDQLGPSIVRDIKGDWRAFYINRYARSACPYFGYPHLFHVCADLPTVMPSRDFLGSELAVNDYKPLGPSK